MSSATTPGTRRMPVLARPVQRHGAGDRAGTGVQAAAADCSKLRGLARDMCYRATSRPR